jgi:hypothetical protein
MLGPGLVDPSAFVSSVELACPGKWHEVCSFITANETGALVRPAHRGKKFDVELEKIDPSEHGHRRERRCRRRGRVLYQVA